MVTSKIVRRNKKTLKNSVDVDTKPRKISTREKIFNVLKDYENGLPMMKISLLANIKSGGNIHQTLNFMILDNQVIKETCPHCNATELYKLNI